MAMGHQEDHQHAHQHHQNHKGVPQRAPFAPAIDYIALRKLTVFGSVKQSVSLLFVATIVTEKCAVPQQFSKWRQASDKGNQGSDRGRTPSTRAHKTHRHTTRGPLINRITGGCEHTYKLPTEESRGDLNGTYRLDWPLWRPLSLSARAVSSSTLLRPVCERKRSHQRMVRMRSTTLRYIGHPNRTEATKWPL